LALGLSISPTAVDAILHCTAKNCEKKICLLLENEDLPLKMSMFSLKSANYEKRTDFFLGIFCSAFVGVG